LFTHDHDRPMGYWRWEGMASRNCAKRSLEHFPCCCVLAESGYVQLFLMEKLHRYVSPVYTCRKNALAVQAHALRACLANTGSLALQAQDGGRRAESGSESATTNGAEGASAWMANPRAGYCRAFGRVLVTLSVQHFESGDQTPPGFAWPDHRVQVAALAAI